MATAVDAQHRRGQSGNELPAANEIVAQMNRERRNDQNRQFQSALSKCFCHKRVTQRIERSHDPKLIHQIRKIDTTTSCPLAVLTDDQRVSVIEQDLRIQLLGETTLHWLICQSGKNQLNLALVECWKFHRRLVHRYNMEPYARMVF